MSEDMSEGMSDDMSVRMSERKAQRMSERMSEEFQQSVRQYVKLGKDHCKVSLKALHEKASVSQSIGVLLPSLQTGGVKDLPVSWLMQRKPQNETQSANAAATMELVEQEIGRPRFHLHQFGWATVYIAAASFTICPA